MLMILKYIGRSEINMTKKFYKKILPEIRSMAFEIPSKKCYSITIGKKEDNDYTNCITDINGTKYDMTQINDMKDIGVIIDSDLKFEKHINSKIGTANKILGIIS